MEQTRLYRSRTDKVLGGVAGGFAEYLKTDPLAVRLICILLAILGGGGVILYILLWIFIPQKPDDSFKTYSNMEQENKTYNSTPPPGQDNKPKQNPDKGNLAGGVILITIGVLFLLAKFIPRVDFHDLWPVILIVGGFLLLRKSFINPNK
ncbi:MAG: PspC domain-containing protein [Bacteroidetes bacterium]|nr:PspC domain-containing protein [Bacteroidota bacterium]